MEAAVKNMISAKSGSSDATATLVGRTASLPGGAFASFAWSVLGHGLVYGALVVILNVAYKAKPPEPSYVSLDMQEFDRPPEPEKKVQRVMRSPAPKEQVVQKAPPDNSPKELQDEKSDVAGTQKAAPTQNLGNTGDGTAATTPYYKIKPKYPKAALIAQVEGWVLLQIDITEQGEVENIRVVGGEQRNMFEGEAKRAVAQYKYKPFTDQSGKPVRKMDHQVRVNFHLVDDEAGT